MRTCCILSVPANIYFLKMFDPSLLDCKSVPAYGTLKIAIREKCYHLKGIFQVVWLLLWMEVFGRKYSLPNNFSKRNLVTLILVQCQTLFIILNLHTWDLDQI